MSDLQQSSIAMESQTISQWALTSVYSLAATSRLRLARLHQHEYDWLDRELANLRTCLSWLATQNSRESARLLIEYIEVFAPYLQQRGLHSELLRWCEVGLPATVKLQRNPGWLLLLSGEVQNALGRWDEANTSFQAAIKASEQEVSHVRVQAMLALGRLQFNQGDYAVAFATMNAAEKLLSLKGDNQQLAALRAERAAYHLNKGELEKALSLYLEIDQFHKQTGACESSDHTLLMLGVVYRKKKEYEQAALYLRQLLERGEEQHSRSTVATAVHHLAWVYLSRGDLPSARLLCGKAIMFYEEIGDIRGISDAYEQLGCIVLAERQGKEALIHLQRSLTMRRQLHNQQGSASSLRHLAIAHLILGHPRAALSNLWQSLAIYQHLGMLSYQRVTNILRELLNWTVGRRQWVK